VTPVAKAAAPSAAVAPSNPPIAGLRRLSDELLSISDLPAGVGWAIGTEPPPHRLSPECVKGDAGTAKPPEVDDAALTQRAGGVVVAALNEELQRWPNPSPPHAVFRRGVDALNGCSKVTSKDAQGNPIPGTIAALALPRFGDESGAWQFQFSEHGTTLTYDFLVIRRASTLIFASYGGFGTPDANGITQLATIAVRKVS
jgi:hypothetical protein